MPNAEKSKQDSILGITANDARLILLGVIHSNSEGKVC
jgi:hypothetical protein